MELYKIWQPVLTFKKNDIIKMTITVFQLFLFISVISSPVFIYLFVYLVFLYYIYYQHFCPSRFISKSNDLFHFDLYISFILYIRLYIK